MSAAPVVRYVLPHHDIPVRFVFANRVEQHLAHIDTVILEPHLRQLSLVWRASQVLGKKITALREVQVGEPRRTRVVGIHRRAGKRHFRGLAATVRWLKARRSGRDG